MRSRGERSEYISEPPPEIFRVGAERERPLQRWDIPAEAHAVRYERSRGGTAINYRPLSDEVRRRAFLFMCSSLVILSEAKNLRSWNN